MSTKKHDYGYDLARMISAVEGQGSQPILTLSGPIDFRDILSAVKTACKDITDREQSASKQPPAKPARRKASRAVRSRGSVSVHA